MGMDPGGPAMSLTASARSTGDTLRQELLVDGRHRLITDEPAQLGGTDTGPAPQSCAGGAGGLRRGHDPDVRPHQGLDAG